MANWTIFHNRDPEGFPLEYVVTAPSMSGAGTIGSPWIVAPSDNVSFTCNFNASNTTVTGLNSGIWGQTSVTLSLFSPPSLSVATGSNLTDQILWQGVTYYVRREAAASDGTPDQFTFTDVFDRPLSQVQTSNLITITGIDISTAVSITGGTYSKNGGAYTSAAGTAVVNDTFRVRHTSSSSNSTPVNTTLTVGGIFDTFTSTTVAVDDDPNAFSLGNNQSDLGRTSSVPLSSFVIAGMDSGVTITVTGSGTAATQVSKNNVDFFTSLTGITNGDTIYSRGTTSSAYNTAVTATVTANTTQDSVTLTTEADPAAGPDEIPFPITTGTIAMSDINDHFAGTGVGVPHNLGSYYRGGTYVPNIGTNSGIPTSGAIAFSDFYGSATLFSFVVDPSFKSSTNSQPPPGSTNISVAWSALSDWEVGPNGSLNIGATEYRYRNFVITQNQNASQVPAVTSGTTTYSTSNTLFRIAMNTVNGQEDFAYGTMIIDARSVADNTKTASKTVQWSLLVISTN